MSMDKSWWYDLFIYLIFFFIFYDFYMVNAWESYKKKKKECMGELNAS